MLFEDYPAEAIGVLLDYTTEQGSSSGVLAAANKQRSAEESFKSIEELKSAIDETGVRKSLADRAKGKIVKNKSTPDDEKRTESWYKDIDKASWIAQNIVFPFLNEASPEVQGVFGDLRKWIDGNT